MVKRYLSLKSQFNFENISESEASVINKFDDQAEY